MKINVHLFDIPWQMLKMDRSKLCLFFIQKFND